MKTLTFDKIRRAVGSTNNTQTGGGGGGTSGGGGTVDYAEEAGHATSADSATTATTATNLDANSTDWQKIARKDIAQSIAEVFTFAKGIVSTLVSKFKAGIQIGPNDQFGIDVNGDTTLRDISARDITTDGDVSVDGKITATGNVEATSGTGKFGGLSVNVDAQVLGDMTIGGDASVGEDLTVTGDTTTKNLRVTKEAHFFKLVVDEFMSNKGALIISNANCVAEVVTEDQSTYMVYFSATDKDGNAVSNPWVVGDLALCLTYKSEGAGTFADVKNRYYWRKVKYVYSNQTYQGNIYHVVCLSKTSGEYDGSTVPAVGDNIVQLGYVGSVAANTYRKSAVILSSYPTMDAGVTPPSLAFYKGINDFALASHRYTFIDGLNNEFMGNFKILVNGSYTNLTTVLATMEGLLSVVQKTVIGKNIIPSEGWQDNWGNLLDSDTFIPSTQKLNAGTDDILYTPIMYLKAGAYVFSCYTDDADAEMYLYTSATNKARPSEMSYGDTISFEGVVSGDTYTPSGGSALPRRYVVIEVQSDCYACLNILDSENDLIIYRPQLEEGSSATAWEIGNVEVRSSELKQAADLIRLQVGNCGLDLTNSKILAKTNKFEIQNQQGVKTFGIDQYGNLESTGNASFRGTIRAQNFYHNTLLFKESYGGSTNYLPTYKFFDSQLPRMFFCVQAPNANFQAGKYYKYSEVASIYDDQTTLYFVETSYDADEILMLPHESRNWHSSYGEDLPFYLRQNMSKTVYLPNPEDFYGKKVEVSNSYFNDSPGYPLVGCVKTFQDANDKRFISDVGITLGSDGNLYANGASSAINKTLTLGKTTVFQALPFSETVSGQTVTKGYWVLIN